jgi:multidrug efflux pump subunit AcrA (membrane-fusion protein)
MNPDGMPNDADIRPGLTARVVFALATNSGTGGYLIPLSAIALDESGRQAGSSSGSQAPTQADNGRRQASVYLFDAAAGAVRLVPVTVGDLRGNRVEVYSGLSEGDQVVAAGVSFLYDGMPAKRWTPDI